MSTTTLHPPLDSERQPEVASQGQILVTGGTGFIGSHLCIKLAQLKHSVRALVRDTSRSRRLREAGIESIVGDLRDRASLAVAMTGVDTVYHIAALFRSEVSRKDMWETNVLGTRNMLDAAREAGVKRFVYCSTVGVHGAIEHPPATEETAYAPGDDYQKSKTEAERLVVQYMKEERLPVVIFRPAGAYGPGDLRFLKLFRAIYRQRFVMLGSGQVLYQLGYIDDLVDGILRCGTSPNAIGEIYILTGEQAVTLDRLTREIADVLNVAHPKLRFPVEPVYWMGRLCELVCKPFGLSPPLYRRRVDFFRKDRAFSISKAQQQLGFQPSIDLGMGLKRTAAWYSEQGLL